MTQLKEDNSVGWIHFIGRGSAIWAINANTRTISLEALQKVLAVIALQRMLGNYFALEKKHRQRPIRRGQNQNLMARAPLRDEKVKDQYIT